MLQRQQQAHSKQHAESTTDLYHNSKQQAG